MDDNPTSIPPLPLKITTTALIAIFVILPITVVISLGDISSIPIILLGGLTLVGLTLGVMFLHRIVLWVHYRFYWYVTAAWFVLLVIFSFVVIVPLMTPLQISTVDRLPVWGKSLFIPGAFVGVVAILLAFRHGRKRLPPLQTSPPLSPAAPPSKPQQILTAAQQIASRKKDLGLDKED